MSSKIIEITTELVHPILEEKNLELVDIEYVKEGKNWFLRVYIDKEGGIDIVECGEVSEQLSEKLDKADPIKEAYFLEVSSPGVEKPLKTLDDFKKNIGNNVFVKLYEKIDGEKTYEGILQNVENDTLSIEYKIKTRKKIVEIPYDKVAKARLAVLF
ncbi:ribosome maturation factor RimP [Oceanobacillus oncorhynchi subsp. incaldanensis]|uniref:Ribosome maturation factor RimP n=1 Tax=Oceanobacillus oncorhynchi TaxID=545501 RepID=A0A0A1MZX2_9BACI|nr:ribosome maturation factor RimP [Oceanobacillus oncorhynchi]MDM8099293.1 ribosome maturation factor RimP [Oceanobacillus oncorhynchi]UUI38576.1 ribosome maturation factor RimP [Oceanobacillus oncorhynchi]GIO18413.1 ribosome maturation factor RimP [Oceanobacillus oncorhynchi subsp. incaldanensis]CEI84266.1 Ribosome maturation factor RimP [Oceanobacillus oncorhynchi]